MRASDALTLMNEQKINQLLIINDDNTFGRRFDLAWATACGCELIGLK